MSLHRKIFLGLIAGLALGAISRVPAAAPLQRILIASEPLGTAFIRLVTMVVVPLVVASLFVGVASLGDVRRLGRIGGRTLAYFLITTVAAFVSVGNGVSGNALLYSSAYFASETIIQNVFRRSPFIETPLSLTAAACDHSESLRPFQYSRS